MKGGNKLNSLHTKNVHRAQPIGVVTNSYQNNVYTHNKPEKGLKQWLQENKLTTRWTKSWEHH